MATFDGKSPAEIFKKKENQLNSILSEVKEEKFVGIAQFLFIGLFGIHHVSDTNKLVKEYFDNNKNKQTFEKLEQFCLLKLQSLHLKNALE